MDEPDHAKKRNPPWHLIALAAELLILVNLAFAIVLLFGLAWEKPQVEALNDTTFTTIIEKSAPSNVEGKRDFRGFRSPPLIDRSDAPVRNKARVRAFEI